MADASQEMRFTLKEMENISMITLFRWILLKQKEIKWKLAFYQLLEQQLKNPEELEKKFMDSLAKLIHDSNKKTET